LKISDLLDAVLIEVIGELVELLKRHRVGNWLDYDRRFDVFNFLLQVHGVADNAGFNLTELFNLAGALFDVLRNRKTEPVMVFNTFLHGRVEVADLRCQQLLLDGLEVVQDSIVRSEQLAELVDVLGVVFFLESDVDDRVGNAVPVGGGRNPDSVQKLGLSDNHFQLRVEVDPEVHLGVVASLVGLVAASLCIEILEDRVF